MVRKNLGGVERMRVVLVAMALLGATGAWAAAWAAPLSVRVLYLDRQAERPPILATLDVPPDDDGPQGARLATADNASTGVFLNHAYALDVVTVAPDADFVAAGAAALAEGRDLIVTNAPAADLLALADLPQARDALIFNAGATDDALRGADCRANVLHAMPSRAMLADGLAQFLMKRRWDKWFLIEGQGPGDAEFAAALRAAATKFGARIVAERRWAFDADMRRNAAEEFPRFTHGVEHDVIVVADEIGDWARYLPYNTWLARPVAGSEGLTPRAWSAANENWGAGQLQSRFQRQAGRPMLDRDYAAWAALRSIGEAVTRTGAADAPTLRAYLLSDAFTLAGFKGAPMTWRRWDGQLRQPVFLAHPRAIAAVAPVEGYLHQANTLDTLGTDAPETLCAAF